MSTTYPNLKATHWGLTSIYNAEVQIGWTDHADVWAETEVPMAEGDVKVQRRGNRYLASTVRVEGDGIELDMAPAYARVLAHALLRAAEVCEATDIADTDPCGHWAPCDCQYPRLSPEGDV